MIWKAKKHHLEDMTLSELVVAYFQYPAIQVYLLLAILGVGYLTFQQLWSPVLVIAGLLVALIYPLIWYVLHRFLLHSNFLYKSPQFASVWKRIHYDHHQDPNDLRVLFGALHTTLPTVAMFSLPIGWAIDGTAGAIAAMSAGVIVTMFYEFCHCIQHLHYTPKNRWLRDMKRLHLLHHFRNERGNYGITNFFWDRLFSTYYDKGDKREKSPSVFNLGYDEEQAKAYPWVASLSQQSNSD